MRHFTAIKYDDVKALSRLIPPPGYDIVAYPLDRFDKIVAIEDRRTKWIYVVTPEDILPDCRIKSSVVNPDRHIATVGLYQAWDISLDLVPLSKVLKLKCKTQSGRKKTSPPTWFHIEIQNPFEEINKRLETYYKEYKYNKPKKVTAQNVKPTQKNNKPSEESVILINHPPTAEDQWIIASLLGLVFLAIFGRKA